MTDFTHISLDMPVHVELNLDPTGFYTEQGITAQDMISSCGVLNQWSISALLCHFAYEKPVEETLKILYSFDPMFREVDYIDRETGISRYPGDPEVAPLLGMVLRGPTEPAIFLYPSAMIALVLEDKILSGRMD